MCGCFYLDMSQLTDLDNPNKVTEIPKGFRLLLYEEKLELQKLDLGVQALKFIRMAIPDFLTGSHKYGWKLGCSGTNINITYIIDERFQFQKFVKDVKKKKAKGQPINLK